MVNERARFDTGEVELSYMEWPGNAPPVLFLHGGVSGLAVWRNLLELRGSLRAYAYDSRGCFHSGRASQYSFVDLARDAIAFLDGVVQAPALLVGHSAGAMTSILVGAERPDLVRAMMLFDPPLFIHERCLGDFQPTFERMAKLSGLPVDELIRNGVAEAVAPSLSMADPGVFAGVVDGSYGEGLVMNEILSRVKCPIVLTHGQQLREREGWANSMISADDVARAKALLPTASFVEIPDSGHIPQTQNAPVARELLSKFLATTGSVS